MKGLAGSHRGDLYWKHLKERSGEARVGIITGQLEQKNTSRLEKNLVQHASCYRGLDLNPWPLNVLPRCIRYTFFNSVSRLHCRMVSTRGFEEALSCCIPDLIWGVKLDTFKALHNGLPVTHPFARLSNQRSWHDDRPDLHPPSLAVLFRAPCQERVKSRASGRPLRLIAILATDRRGSSVAAPCAVSDQSNSHPLTSTIHACRSTLCRHWNRISRYCCSCYR